MQQKERLT